MFYSSNMTKNYTTNYAILAYQNRVSQKEIIKRAVAFYEKASIFDNLVK
jgi:hypothetical protein